MTNFLGEDVKYLLARIHGENEREEVANYNEYNSTFTFMTEISRATHFDDLEKAKGLRDIQQMLADFMGSGHQFKVIKQEITRTLVEEEASE